MIRGVEVVGLKLQSAARANRLRGFGLSAMGFAAWLAIGSQAEAFPYWGSSEPARPAAHRRARRDAKPRKKVAKKPVVRKLTEAEKRSDGDVLSRTRGKQLLVSISLEPAGTHPLCGRAGNRTQPHLERHREPPDADRHLLDHSEEPAS